MVQSPVRSLESQEVKTIWTLIIFGVSDKANLRNSFISEFWKLQSLSRADSKEDKSLFNVFASVYNFFEW